MRRDDWPQTLNKAMLANFKDPDRFTKHAGRAPWRARRLSRGQHLFLVGRLWSTLGHERTDIDCHHLQGGPARKHHGLGMKSPDRFVVPLAHWRHMELHSLGSRHELEYFMDNGGINPYHLADALYINSGELARMGRVLVAHQMQGSVNLLMPGWQCHWRAAFTARRLRGTSNEIQ